MQQFALILPILFPILSGLLLLCLPGFTKNKKINGYAGVSLVVTALLVVYAIMTAKEELVFFSLNESLPLMLKIDNLGKLFVCIVTVIWLCCGFFAFSYMEHEKNLRRFFSFYLISTFLLNPM